MIFIEEHGYGKGKYRKNSVLDWDDVGAVDDSKRIFSYNTSDSPYAFPIRYIKIDGVSTHLLNSVPRFYQDCNSTDLIKLETTGGKRYISYITTPSSRDSYNYTTKWKTNTNISPAITSLYGRTVEFTENHIYLLTPVIGASNARNTSLTKINKQTGAIEKNIVIPSIERGNYSSASIVYCYGNIFIANITKKIGDTYSNLEILKYDLNLTLSYHKKVYSNIYAGGNPILYEIGDNKLLGFGSPLASGLVYMYTINASTGAIIKDYKVPSSSTSSLRMTSGYLSSNIFINNIKIIDESNRIFLLADNSVRTTGYSTGGTLLVMDNNLNILKTITLPISASTEGFASIINNSKYCFCGHALASPSTSRGHTLVDISNEDSRKWGSKWWVKNPRGVSGSNFNSLGINAFNLTRIPIIN